MKVTAIVNFTPGQVISVPGRLPSYLYLHGQMAFTDDEGFVDADSFIRPVGSGIALHVFPAVIGGKPGGALTVAGQHVERFNEIQFAGDFQVVLPV